MELDEQREKRRQAGRDKRAETARNLTSAQRRGMHRTLAHTRSVVVSFSSAEEAEMWDDLDDEAAFYWLWQQASRSKGEAEKKR